MLEIETETGGNIVALRASGKVTKADQDAIFPKLEDVLDQQPAPLRALIDYADLEDIEQGVKTDALWFDMRYRSSVERIAIVATKTWQGEVARTAQIYKAAQVRRFEPEDREAAWAWLRG